jgi:hypothetical protein
VLLVVLMVSVAMPADPGTRILRVAAVAQAAGQGLSFSTTFQVNEFIVQDDQLTALGELAVVDFAGNTDTVPVALPVKDMQANQECQMLTLSLGPLDTKVLGIAIQANGIDVEVVANPDKGFLGNMLCTIAETYQNGDLETVAVFLNEVIQLFG